MKRYKICGIVTKAFAIRAFVLDNLKYTQTQGVDCSFVCEPEEFSKDELGDLTYFPIKMGRGYVSPFEIIRVIYQLTKLFKREKFYLIQYSSSNAGLYAAIAGWLAGVPVRIFCMWGLSLSDAKGWNYMFYKILDKIICYLSTSVQPDSYANLKLAMDEKLIDSKKGYVIHKGSAAGVDLNKFNISKKSEWRSDVRKQYNIPESAKVFGFVGRLVPEKGLNELFAAFCRLNYKDVHLIMVGPYYNVSALNQELYIQMQNDSRVTFVGPVLNPARYYAAMDFFVLPSYREGFGSVVIEAGGLGVPSICSNINGPTEYVKEGITGLLCETKSTDSLYEAIVRAISMTDEEYQRLSTNAYESVRHDFDAEVFRQYFYENRIKLIKEAYVNSI